MIAAGPFVQICIENYVFVKKNNTYMKVALYFGSFNPLHRGHLAICKYLLECNEFDQVRIILSPGNPLKDSSLLVSARARFNHINESMERLGLDKIVVSDIEMKMVPPLYTIHTLEKLSANEPENSFVMIIGADNLSIIERWYEWEKIVGSYEIWVYPRYGYDAEALCRKYGAHLIDAPLVDISSTEIREAERAGRNMNKYRI